MVNYANGKVYMIEPTVERLDEGDIYIGSSAKEHLSQRMCEHRLQYNKWTDGRKVGKFSSYDLFDKYGVENCKITLLEVCSCNSRDELTSRESHYIRTLKCVNKCVPGRTRIEYRADNREYILNDKKNYRAANRESIALNRKIPFECECGSICRKEDKTRHYRTDKHLEYVANKEYSN